MLLDVGRWDDLGRKVQPLAEVLEAFRGQSIVVVLPGESSLEVAARSQGLASLDDLKLC